MRKLLLTLLFGLLITTNAFTKTLVNDGDITWGGNWQTTVKVDALHASTNLNVDNTTTQYSGYWTGVLNNVDYGCLAYLATLTTPATARVFTVTLESATDTAFTIPIATATATYTTAAETKLLTWIYFKLSSAITEDSVIPLYYRYKFVSDNAADSGFRADNAATTKVAIVQILQATGTQAAADVSYIVGNSTQTSGNPDATTVTVDTNYSATTSGSLVGSNGGILAFSTVNNTTSYLKINGNQNFYNGFAINIGTVAIPIPSNSTATLEWASSSSGFSWNSYDGSQFIASGYPKFSTPTQFRCNSTDAISPTSDTNVSVSINPLTAGWVAGDVITISGTSAISGQTENKIIESVSSSTVNITTSWTSTHLVGAELCDITRNAVIKKSGSNGPMIVYNTNLSAWGWNWTQIVGGMPASDYSGYIWMQTGTKIAIDNSVFWTGGGTVLRGGLGLSTMNNLTFSNLIFYNMVIGMHIGNCNNITFNNISGSLISNNAGNALIRIDNSYITVNNGNFYDRGAGANIAYGISSNSLDNSGNDLTLNTCNFWGFNTTGATGNGLYLPGYNKVTVKNCRFGSDGTNTLIDGTSDIYSEQSNVKLYNTILVSLTQISNPTYQGIVYSHDHNATQYRYKTWEVNGNMTDNTTTSMADQSGSGRCLVMNPSSSTAGNTLNWEFGIPVTAATNPALTFYIKASAGTPTLNIDIYDSDDDSTLLCNNESLTFAAPVTTWTQKTPTFAANPTDTGWCRVVLKALDDGSLRNIGVDTMTFANAGTTYYYNFTEWKDGLPNVFGAAGGGAAPAAGGSIQSHGYSN